jgi:serine/threonine-protein kinase HipA
VLSAWPVIGKRANEIPLEKARLAMALPGERPRYHLAIIQRRHFEVLAKKLGLGAAAGTLIDQMLAKTATVIGDVQRELPRGFPQALAGRIFDGMGRAAKLLGGTDT